MRWVQKPCVKNFRLDPPRRFFDCVRKPDMGFSRKRPFSTDKSDCVRSGLRPHSLVVCLCLCIWVPRGMKRDPVLFVLLFSIRRAGHTSARNCVDISGKICVVQGNVFYREGAVLSVLYLENFPGSDL